MQHRVLLRSAFKDRKQLTKGELVIMHALWLSGEATVPVLRKKVQNGNLAYTTVSTMVRILQKKGYVGYRRTGKTHVYFPLVSKNDYAKAFVKDFLKTFFDGSIADFLRFIRKEIV